eukprot:COSAG04_NODE_2089_length_4822_cov_39.655939_6_plen_326_part_00
MPVSRPTPAARRSQLLQSEEGAARARDNILRRVYGERAHGGDLTATRNNVYRGLLHFPTEKEVKELEKRRNASRIESVRDPAVNDAGGQGKVNDAGKDGAGQRLYLNVQLSKEDALATVTVAGAPQECNVRELLASVFTVDVRSAVRSGDQQQHIAVLASAASATTVVELAKHGVKYGEHEVTITHYQPGDGEGRAPAAAGAATGASRRGAAGQSRLPPSTATVKPRARAGREDGGRGRQPPKARRQHTYATGAGPGSSNGLAAQQLLHEGAAAAASPAAAAAAPERRNPRTVSRKRSSRDDKRPRKRPRKEGSSEDDEWGVDDY